MKYKKILACIAVTAIAAVSAFAVFNEKDLAHTLTVLRGELHQELEKKDSKDERFQSRNDSQHFQMVSMLKKCNELSLILYSQNQDYTFDVTYALKEATRQYNEFSKDKMPYEDMVSRLDLEIDRYERLIKSLKQLPSKQRMKEVFDSLRTANPGMPMMLPMPPGDRPVMPDSLRAALMSAPSAPEQEKPEGPFILDEQSTEDRDSCVFYAEQLLRQFKRERAKVIADSTHYDNASIRIKETYEYAQDRYKVIQKRIFTDGQDNYFHVLRHIGSYASEAFRDASEKYGLAADLDYTDVKAIRTSEWRGTVVLGFVGASLIYLLLASLVSVLAVTVISRFRKSSKWLSDKSRRRCVIVLLGVVIFALTVMVAKYVLEYNFFAEASNLILIFAWLCAATLLSMFIRLRGRKVAVSMHLYLPVILMGFLVIAFRIIFIPNKLVNLIFPPLLLLSFFWQLRLCNKHRKEAETADMVLAWITLVVTAAVTVCAWSGYVLLSVQAYIWWLFQLAAIDTIIAFNALLKRYETKNVKAKIAEYKAEHKHTLSLGKKGAYISVTWLFDFIEMVVMPMAGVLSLPVCVWLATDVFDLTEVCKNAYYANFFNLTDTGGNEIVALSFYKIVLVTCLFFLFRYLSYLLRAVYRQLQIDKIARESGQHHIHRNQINLTLANNVINILVWGAYVILAVVLLKIPMGALSIIAAGLATGLGLAMKDILNNFIYGIQLMSGRLRVGDYVECDGVRGVVDSITYQSTQIATADGAIMAFTNTTLFNKNFKNLTRNNSYEFVKVEIGVAYGSDVDEVRAIILETVETLRTKDSYGRDILDPAKDVTVVFDSFGDSSVNLAVKQYVLVMQKMPYVAALNEAVYKALNSHGIEIPFPQRDIHIKQ